LLGPEHAEVANVLHNLGIVLGRVGRRDEAAEKLERALAIREKTFGPHSLEVAKSASSLGDVYLDAGDPAAARRLLTRGLDIRLSRRGEDHADVADSLARLSRLEIREDRLRDAEAHAARAVAIREKLPPYYPALAPPSPVCRPPRRYAWRMDRRSSGRPGTSRRCGSPSSMRAPPARARAERGSPTPCAG
jgi:tetratricopeptide (TPR) repeat protein